MELICLGLPPRAGDILLYSPVLEEIALKLVKMQSCPVNLQFCIVQLPYSTTKSERRDFFFFPSRHSSYPLNCQSVEALYEKKIMENVNAFR